MTMCMRLDLMKNHIGGGPAVLDFDNFADQQEKGWTCQRASQGLNVYLGDFQLGLYSVNQMRFDADRGVMVEKNRINQIPDTVNFTSWTKTGGALHTESDPTFVTNQNVAVFSGDYSVGLHTFYCYALVNDMNEVSFYTFFETGVSSIRLESQAFKMQLFPDGSTNQPNYVKAKILSNGWIKWNINLPAAGATLFAIYLLDPDGAVSWEPTAPAIIKVFGVAGFRDEIEHTYFPTHGAVAETGERDILSKAPYAGFNGNNFGLILQIKPLFDSADAASLGNLIVFEWGVNGTDQIKLYYSSSSNQFTFDRWSNGESCFVQCQPFDFFAGENITLTIAQKVGYGVSIAANSFSAQNTVAPAAKSACSMPSGNMFLGCDTSGFEQINASIQYIKRLKI